jgi:hypothetical protein
VDPDATVVADRTRSSSVSRRLSLAACRHHDPLLFDDRIDVRPASNTISGTRLRRSLLAVPGTGAVSESPV